MAKLTAKDDPELILEMEEMERTTPAHYNEWNTRHQQLLNNDSYLSNYNANSNIFKMENPKYTGTEAYPNYGAQNYTITDDVFAGVPYGGYAWDLETEVGKKYTISLTNAINKKIFADESITSEEGISSLIFTAKTKTTKIGVLYGYNGNYQSETKIQVNEGSDIKQYAKYNGKSNLHLSNNVSATELEKVEIKMLGWTAQREMPSKNTVSGNTFIQRVSRVDLGRLSWTLHPNYNCFYATLNDGKSTLKVSGSSNAYCSKYELYSGSYKTQPDKTYGVGYAFENGSSCEVLIKDSSFTDTTSFKNAMQGVYLYYELDTPVEIQIDGNEITTLDTVSDKWDIKKTYTVGEYCIYNNSLWKCLVQHSNVTPTEGTYWTKVTIASELKNRVTYVKTINKSVSISANTWTAIDSSLNYFENSYIFTLIHATSNWDAGTQTWGKLRANTSSGKLEFCPDTNCDHIAILITTIK